MAKKNKYKNKKTSTSRGNWETSSYPADADTNEWDENSPPAAEAATMGNIIQFPTQPKTEEKELLNQHGKPLNTQLLLPPASTPSAEQPTTQATQEAPTAKPATQTTQEAPTAAPTAQATQEAPAAAPTAQATQEAAPTAQPIKEASNSQPTTQKTPTPQPTTEIQTQRIQSALLSDLQGIFRWWLLIGFLATIAAPSWMTFGGLSIYFLCAFGAFAAFLKHSFIGFKTPQYFR